MAFADQVRAVLSDTLNLPQDFLGYLPQYVAQNPVSVAKTSGTRLASGTNTSSVSTAGTTFAGGADLLSTALQFQATGNNDYIVRATATDWYNNNAAGANQLRANLDGADVGLVGQNQFTAALAFVPMDCVGILVKPSTGSHSLNVRLVVTAGTGTVEAGSGGAGAKLPIIVTLEVA